MSVVLPHPEVHGTVDARFEPVREVFANHFARGFEVGAAIAVSVDGELVVDLWAGTADRAGTRPWTGDTLVSVASTTKGFMATCMHMLVDRGLLDIDALVAAYWPEFAAEGKGDIRVRHVLSHAAGLPAPSVRVDDAALYDWQTMTAALAASRPFWKAGEKHGYHAATFGWLAGEVLRRIDGRSPGTFLREEVAQPLGVDFHIGVPADALARCADIVPPAAATTDAVGGDIPRDSMAWLVFNNPPRRPSEMSSPRWRAAELPSSNGHGSARGIARFYAALAHGGELGGVRLLRAETLDRAVREQRRGVDAIIGVDARWALGYSLPNRELGDVRSARAFGHAGAGGSLGFADPEHGLGFGYVMNQMGPRIDTRSARLMRAVYRCLGAVDVRS